MNLLAHQILAWPNPEAMAGNFMADHVKGRIPTTLPLGIQQGIAMHRLIDATTDAHPATARSVARLRPHIGRYAPVAIDVFYDHVLAREWAQFGQDALPAFVQHIYAVLDAHAAWFPERTQGMFSHMRTHNWLGNYASLEGIARTLDGIARRTRFPSGLGEATPHLQTEYQAYKNDFETLWPDVQAAVATLT